MLPERSIGRVAAQEGRAMTLEIFATLAITVGVPIFLLAEEVVRRLALRAPASRERVAATPRPVPGQVLAARRAA
jgi:hypothetical protein